MPYTPNQAGKKYNLYFNTEAGNSEKIENLTIKAVLKNVETCLIFGDEITSIIDVEKD